MDDDDERCLCFHVSRRKVIQFIRVNRPTVPSQLSECYGAGTGCGWCRPFLEKLFREALSQTFGPETGIFILIVFSIGITSWCQPWHD